MYLRLHYSFTLTGLLNNNKKNLILTFTNKKFDYTKKYKEKTCLIVIMA